jgi:hypothetical protein
MLSHEKSASRGTRFLLPVFVMAMAAVWVNGLPVQ